MQEMKYVCTVCGYVYDEAAGIPGAGIAAGTKWEELPADWTCPMCGASKSEFRAVEAAAAAPAAPVKKAAPAAESGGESRRLSSMELSAVCSNLARGCEKQYRADEAELFRALADHFKSVSPAHESTDYAELLALVEKDLDGSIPEAFAAARGEGDRGAQRALTWSEKVTRIQKSLLSRYEKEGEAMLENTGVWVCTICGFISIGDTPPELCPVCKVPGWKFEKVQGR